MRILKHKLIFSIFFFLFCFGLCAQNLRINEVLASNASMLDEDDDYSDWIELYNNSSVPVSLKDFKINDGLSSENAWVLPDVLLPAEGYFLFWASSKNRLEGPYHSDFKLSEKETVYLFDNNDALIDSVFIGTVCTDVSIGRSDAQIRYFQETTPGAQNSSNAFEGVLENSISFSNQGGKVSPLSLSLIANLNDVTIRYTTDASLPNETSMEYTGDISINSNTVVRARLFKDNFLPSKTSSRSYLVAVDHTLPVVALVTEPSNFFDEDDGIYVLGTEYVNQFPFFGANFWEDWERPLHFSLYEGDSLAFALNAGTKIFGGWSRANDQRSLSIFARNGYGTANIKHKLFPENSYDEFEAIVLRNSGNDFLRSSMRDITLTSLMRDSGLEFSSFKPVATYLNGEYWGMYNLREKINEHFLASKRGVDPSQIDILEFGGATVQGDSTEYLELISFIENNSLASDSNFELVANEIDVDNFIIYQVAQIYFDNTDWPGNNIKFWRTPETKWRWILYDIDFGFGIWTAFSYFNNTLGFALEENGPAWPNPPWSTLLFRKCVENIGFRNKFVNRFADELNSRFLPEQVIQHIANTESMIESEIDRHFLRWGGNPSGWEDEVGVMRLFANNRPARVKDHILGEFNLPDYRALNLEMNDSERGFIYINRRLKINELSWTGDYFETVPIELIAIPQPGYVFSHWEEDVNSTESKLVLDVDSNKKIRAVFEEANASSGSIIINEINYNSSADFDTKDWVEIHNTSDNYMDLSGWYLKDNDDDHCFAFKDSRLMAGKEFFVISRNLSAFREIHPAVENVIGGLGFGLSSNQDELRLFNAFDNLVDSVSFTPIDPWTELANGQGYTLELKRPDLDNLLPENWAGIHINGSPGLTNEEVSSSISEFIEGLEITSFPNPVHKEIKISLTLMDSKELSIDLISEDGRYLQNLKSGLLPKGLFLQRYTLASYPPGIYFVRVSETSGHTIIRKIIKQ